MHVDDLRPGDVLLYRGTSIFAALIRLKTWSEVSHVEIYAGHGHVIASRPIIGVGYYDLAVDNLVAVLRPREPFDDEAAERWFVTVDGQGYDWIGLLNFWWARYRGADNLAMFCSEFATRCQRAGGVRPFSDDYDADTVAPGMFLCSPAYDRVSFVNFQRDSRDHGAAADARV